MRSHILAASSICAAMLVGLGVVVPPRAAPAAETTNGAALSGTETVSSDASAAEKWTAPKPAEVRDQALAWLKDQKVPAEVTEKATALWADTPDSLQEAATLERLVDTLALGSADVAKLAELCSSPNTLYRLPDQSWLKAESTADLVGNNLRLFYARWLVHQELYDEALEQLAGLSTADVVAPAMLLFYQGISYHSLLDKEAGLKTIARLMGEAEQSPRRYVALARLMEEDLNLLQDDSLDHIARRMGDVRRRLDHGRAGKKVRDQQDGIIESLDKIIKRLEEQQRQSQGGGGGMQDTIRSSSPAPDSMPIGGKGPGDVNQRNVGEESGWGNLPPAEREKALHNLGRDFPSHYRDVIEAYFRRLAAEESR
ncbi:MAG: hypothetical protein ACOY3P_01520 [Planctomycetota bacterium]